MLATSNVNPMSLSAGQLDAEIADCKAKASATDSSNPHNARLHLLMLEHCMRDLIDKIEAKRRADPTFATTNGTVTIG